MRQVSISACSEMEEGVVGLLEEFFQVPAAVYCDARTGRRVVTCYPKRLRGTMASIRAQLREAGRGIFPAGRRWPITLKNLRRENWAESWKRHFKAMEIGNALLIKPGWSRRRARPGQRVIWLDPGLSFGTGHHATTAFCLAELAACRRPGARQSFLDIGTGSGILAIAAAKLGYAPVAAFDEDPEAVRVSRRNARRNRVQERVRPQRKDLRRLGRRSGRRWDVVCANLQADLLEAEAEKIVARVQRGGQLIVAGILRKEFSRICDKFVTIGLTLVKCEAHKEWQSGRFIA